VETAKECRVELTVEERLVRQDECCKDASKLGSRVVLELEQGELGTELDTE
jgi:hypothetical protein